MEILHGSNQFVTTVLCYSVLWDCMMDKVAYFQRMQTSHFESTLCWTSSLSNYMYPNNQILLVYILMKYIATAVHVILNTFFICYSLSGEYPVFSFTAGGKLFRVDSTEVHFGSSPVDENLVHFLHRAFGAK